MLLSTNGEECCVTTLKTAVKKTRCIAALKHELRCILGVNTNEHSQSLS